jgi:hypothetical protein
MWNLLITHNLLRHAAGLGMCVYAHERRARAPVPTRGRVSSPFMLPLKGVRICSDCEETATTLHLLGKSGRFQDKGGRNDILQANSRGRICWRALRWSSAIHEKAERSWARGRRHSRERERVSQVGGRFPRNRRPDRRALPCTSGESKDANTGTILWGHNRRGSMPREYLCPSQLARIVF